MTPIPVWSYYYSAIFVNQKKPLLKPPRKKKSIGSALKLTCIKGKKQPPMPHDSWVVIVVVVVVAVLDSILQYCMISSSTFRQVHMKEGFDLRSYLFFPLKKLLLKKIWKKKKKTTNKQNLGIQIFKVGNWHLWFIYYYIHYVYIKYVSSWRIWKWVWCIITQVPTSGGRKKKRYSKFQSFTHTYLIMTLCTKRFTPMDQKSTI